VRNFETDSMLPKKILYRLLILTIAFSSCQATPPLTNTSYNRAKKNFEFSADELKSVGIDTSDIYKAYSSWIGSYDFDSNERKNYSKREDVRDIYGSPPTQNEFIKFQSEGKIDFYYLSKEIPMTNDLFQQNSGLTGVYDIHKDVIHIKRYLGIGHGPKLVRGKIKIKGDTLHLIEKGGGYNFHVYYIKTDFVND
jgi:hypothetical protein